MTELELLKDCLQRLNRSGLAYCLTGSMASNYWGIPRTTHDLDFVLQLPPSRIPALLAAFADDFLLDEAAVRAAYRPPYQFNALDRRSALKVDFWLPANTPFEREAFRRRLSVTLFGIPAWMASAEDVILHKLHWNQISPSERQLADAAGVYLVQANQLDLDYLQRWAEALAVKTTWEAIRAGRIRPKLT